MHSIVYTTSNSEKEANKIAEHLLKKRLIACANLFPIKSIYHWNKELIKEEEVGVFLKTRSELVDEVIKEIKKQHSYDIPCIISLPIKKGNADFLSWISDETS